MNYYGDSKLLRGIPLGESYSHEGFGHISEEPRYIFDACPPYTSALRLFRRYCKPRKVTLIFR